MSQIGELMALFLQESDNTERSLSTMDGVDRFRRRRSLHERLGLKSIVCCGSIWGIGPSNVSTRLAGAGDDDVVDSISIHQQIDDRTSPEIYSDPDCIPPSPRMNLADALAAERHFRSTAGVEPVVTATNQIVPRVPTAEPGMPLRVSLMRLLEETDGQDEKEGVGKDQVCCVCMGRKKAAAFIPCGHTFCRVCSRELWLNRGTCPLCNRSILEILDIY